MKDLAAYWSVYPPAGELMAAAWFEGKATAEAKGDKHVPSVTEIALMVEQVNQDGARR